MVFEIHKARDFAMELAREAGEILVAMFGVLREGNAKGGNIRDIVTKADLESEKILVDRISKAYPKYGILSEEGGTIRDRGKCVWILDSLCGTTNYSQGIAYFGISIALARGPEVLLGVVYNPTNGELFHAIRREGAYLAKSKLHVSTTDQLSRAFLCVEWGQSEASIVKGIHYFANLARVARKVRFYGSAALNLANLAAGRLDAYVDQLYWWDFAAGTLIVEEAGGQVTDLRGTSVTPLSREIIATNGKLHASILGALSDPTST